MVRTRADSSARKAVAAKAPRKQFSGTSSGSAGSSSSASLSSPNSAKSKYAGGNPVRWWPSPSWQKGIGQFFSSANDSNNCDNSTSELNSNSDSPSPQPGASTKD